MVFHQQINPKNFRTKDLVILNFSKEYTLDPLPMMFIPTSSKTIIKQTNCDVLSTILKLIMTNLNYVFVNGFPIQFMHIFSH
jgi:hypothetical protein